MAAKQTVEEERRERAKKIAAPIEKAKKKKADEEALTHKEPEGDVRMTIWEHLAELRTRLTRAAIGVGIATIACWVYHEKLLHFLVIPYEIQWKLKNPTIP